MAHNAFPILTETLKNSPNDWNKAGCGWLANAVTIFTFYILRLRLTAWYNNRLYG